MNKEYSPSPLLQLLNPDNSMSINRFIAHAIGVKETFIYFALISKMTYYFQNEMLDEDGFFYATAIDIQESTTYTKKIQMPAIEKLEQIGLIKTKYSGLPRRKFYKVLNNQELIIKLLEKGEKIAVSLKEKRSENSDYIQQLQNVTASCNIDDTAKTPEKPHNNQQLQKVTARSDKMSPQEATKSNSKERQNGTARSDKMSLHTYKSKDNKTKDIKPYQSIISDIDGQTTLDEMDMNDKHNKTNDRLLYEELIKENIEYDWYTEAAQSDWKVKEQLKTIDEMVAIMLDVICSTKATIRVNSEEIPHETAKSQFLKINQSHVDYVIDAMKNSPSDIRNIRNYLITALYNAPSTIENYYNSRVNHDLHGGDN